MNKPAGLSNFQILATCPPGLENVLSSELESIGKYGKKIVGGIEFHGDLLSLYTVNLWSRVAGRILVRLGKFKLFSLNEAPEKFARFPWELYLNRCRDLRVRATCHKSRIFHSGALCQRLVQGISKRLREPVNLVSDKEGEELPLVMVRVVKNRCQISVDSSGAHLYKRGYKKFSVRAPLRENLAAAMIIASGWSGTCCLLDPFCGSGTVVMEAILMAASIPPGRRRKFAFMNWKNFDARLWNQLLWRSDRLFTEPKCQILGIDRDPHAVESTLANLEHAGLSDFARITRADILRTRKDTFPKTGQIVTNPPYGKRLRTNHSLVRLYSGFGQILRTTFRDWKVSVLCPTDAHVLRRAMNFPLRRSCTFSHGGIKVDLLTESLNKNPQF